MWDLLTILEWLDREGGTITVKDGIPRVDFLSRKPDEREALVTFILPHLRARRFDLLHHFRGFKNVQHEQMKREEERKRIIAETVRAAAGTGKRVLYMKRNGKMVQGDARPVVRHFKHRNPPKVVIPLEREATSICIEGSAWILLPRVTNREEDEILEPKKFKRSTQYQHKPDGNPQGFISED